MNKSHIKSFLAPGLLSYWKQTFNLKIFLTTLFFVFLTTFFYLLLNKKNKENNYQNDKILGTLLMIFGIILFTGIILTFSFITDQSSSDIVSFFGRGNRTFWFISTAFGFITSGMIINFIKSKKVIYIFFVCLISLNIVSLATERLSYIEAWNTEKKIISKIEKLTTGRKFINSECLIMLVLKKEYVKTKLQVPIFDDQWTPNMILRIYFKNKKINTQLFNDISEIQKKTKYEYLGDFDKKMEYNTKQIFIVDLKNDTLISYENFIDN